MNIDLSQLLIIKKTTLAFAFLCIGVFWAFFGGLMPWFLWPTAKVNIAIAGFFVLLSLYFSIYYCEEDIFSRQDYALPASLGFIVLIFIRIVNLNSFFGFIDATLTAIILFAIMKLNLIFLRRMMDILCKLTGGFLAISIFFFILNLAGFTLPSSSTATEDMFYTFENYYFFMIDDRQFLAFIPRFHSVFLEPGHLGTATTLLLLTQIGRWNKWYNIILIIATLMTFSLAAYILFMMAMMASAWVQHKKVFIKVIGTVIILAGVGIAAFFYQQGDNMLYSMIIERLEVSDGKMTGDNRVTQSFEAIYDEYMKSNDIWFGREYSLEAFGFGNSGYRVFLYDNGLICTFLVFLFYLAMVRGSQDRRAAIVMLIISLACFWARAAPMSLHYLIPLYALPYMKDTKKANVNQS